MLLIMIYKENNSPKCTKQNPQVIRNETKECLINEQVQIYATQLYIIGKSSLFVCVLRPFNSEVIQRRHPHLLSLAKDVKFGKYTVPTGNRTPGRRVAVHYATSAPRKLHSKSSLCGRYENTFNSINFS